MKDIIKEIEKVKDTFHNLIATLDPAILPEDEQTVSSIVDGLNTIENRLQKDTTNHFKTALSDPEVVEKYKNKPFHMAVLNALSKYKEKGYKLSDLPWFQNK